MRQSSTASPKRFCPWCGYDLRAYEHEEMVCPECGIRTCKTDCVRSPGQIRESPSSDMLLVLALGVAIWIGAGIPLLLWFVQ